MTNEKRERDPEIVALTMQIHGLTGQIRTLAVQIDKTVLLLEKYDQAEKEKTHE